MLEDDLTHIPPLLVEVLEDDLTHIPPLLPIEGVPCRQYLFSPLHSESQLLETPENMK